MLDQRSSIPAAPSVRFCSDETSVLSCGLDGQIVEWSLHMIGLLVASHSLPTVASLDHRQDSSEL